MQESASSATANRNTLRVQSEILSAGLGTDDFAANIRYGIPRKPLTAECFNKAEYIGRWIAGGMKTRIY